MKRAVPFKLALILLLIPLLSMASENPGLRGKHKKEKVIKKEFKVSANANLSVNNSYGNLDIVTWNENRIVFEITVMTSGNNEEKVQDRLDDITVEFEADRSNVSARTKFNKGKSSSWWNWGGKNNVHMKVNYIVKVPITNSIDLNNDYGNINVGKLKGRAKINCDYGKITTKELLADDNELRFDYTSGCYFDYIKTGKINADYSSYKVGKTKALDINADYTQSEVDIAEDVTYNCDYGSLKVHNANTVSGNGDYATVIIGDIYKAVSIKASYGAIKIEKLHPSFKGLNIKSDYTGIKIGYDSSLNFDFELDLDYADISGDTDFNFVQRIQESHRKKYFGYYGAQNSRNKLTISSDYGGVTFYKH